MSGFWGVQNTYKGVLLHTDFISKIACVKILCRKQLRVPKWGKLGSMRKGDEVVGAGCNWVNGNWKNTISGLFSWFVQVLEVYLTILKFSFIYLQVCCLSCTWN